MPQLPIVLPLIITGLTLGSVLVSKSRAISKRKLAGVSSISGLLNSAYAYVYYEVNPPPTFSRGGTLVRFQSLSETDFVISSFIIGFIFVIAVCGIALAYARFRGKKEMEEKDLEDEVEDEKALEET